MKRSYFSVGAMCSAGVILSALALPGPSGAVVTTQRPKNLPGLYFGGGNGGGGVDNDGCGIGTGGGGNGRPRRRWCRGCDGGLDMSCRWEVFGGIGCYCASTGNGQIQWAKVNCMTGKSTCLCGFTYGPASLDNVQSLPRTLGNLSGMGFGTAIQSSIIETTGWIIVGSGDDASSPFGGWASDPVIMDSGELTLTYTDMRWDHDGTWVAVDRRYFSQEANPAGSDIDFGRNFHTNLRIFVDEIIADHTTEVELGLGERITFKKDNPWDPFVAEAGFERLELTKISGQYKLTDKHGYQYWFEPSVDPANLISTRSRHDQGENYEYNASGILTTIEVTGVGDIDIDRDAANLITEIHDYASRTLSYAYDTTNNNLTRVEDACGSCSALSNLGYGYDGSNRIDEIKDAYRTVLNIAYDSSTGTVDYYVDANNATYDFAYGTPSLAIDPLDNTTEFTFDGNGNLTTKNYTFGAGDDATYVYKYDANFHITEAELPNDSVVHNRYDTKGNVTKAWVVSASDTITTFEATYSSDYNQILLAIDALDNTTEYQYDSNGSMTKMIRPNTAERTLTYDSKGLPTSIVDAVGTSFTLEYDGVGFITSGTRDSGGLGLETTWVVDVLGRSLTMTTPENDGVIMEYDKAGRLTSEKSAKGVEQIFEYDGNGRQTKLEITRDSTTLSQVFAFDKVGNQTLVTEWDGDDTTYAYDLGRNMTKRTGTGGRVLEQVYDQLGRVLTTKVGDTSGTTLVGRLDYDTMGQVTASAEASGDQTTHTYDGFGRRVTTTDCLSDYAVVEYDAMRATAQKRYDSSNNIKSHSVSSFDSLGRITGMRAKANPGGADGSNDVLTESTYDDEDRTLKQIVHTDASNASTTTFAYDPLGRRTKATDPGNNDTTYEFDKEDLVTKATDANNNDTTFTYDADGLRVSSMDANGDYSVTTYDMVRPLATFIKRYDSGNTLLAETEYEYDIGSQLTLVRRHAASAADDVVTEALYDLNRQVTATVSARGNTTTYSYDSQGRPTRFTLPDGGYEITEYDADGGVTKQVAYAILAGSTHTFETRYTLDCFGRVLTGRDQGPDGTYGNADDLSTQYVYDALGGNVTVTDEAGIVTTYEYDSLSRQTKATEDVGGIGRVTNLVFGRAGRLDKLIAVNSDTGDQTTSYTYDARGLQVTVNYPETGDVITAYNDVGILIKRTDEEGVAVDFEFDKVYRLTKRLKNSATTDIDKYVYDGLGRMVTAQRGTSGDPDAVSRSIFNFNLLSRLTQESQAIAGGTAKAIDYTYDKGGNRISMIYHGTVATVTYAYDNRGRPTDVDLDGDPLADYTWLGNVLTQRDVTSNKTFTIGEEFGTPAFKTVFSRDGVLRVTKVENLLTTADQDDFPNLGSWDYTYDVASNPLSEVNTGASMGYLEATRYHDYDDLHRLTTSRLTDAQAWPDGGGSEVTTTYTYDDLGNRVSHSYRDAAAIAYSHDKANRMTTLAGNTQGYDLAGNLTLGFSADRGTTYTYTYDHNNRLIQVDNQDFESREAVLTYDALGRRIEVINDTLETTTRYYYDGVNEVVETNQNGTNQRWYVHGVSYVDERLMMMDPDSFREPPNPRPYYYVIDRMYNVRGLVDRAGALVERWTYDSYGRPLIREAAGRGDMDTDSDIDSIDLTRHAAVVAGTLWDPRGDLNDDGDVDGGFDGSDASLLTTKKGNWHPEAGPTVAQAFSDFDNPFGWQGRVHFAFDTAAAAEDGKLMFVDHRLRLTDVATGRWLTRDPIGYAGGSANLYEYVGSNPRSWADPLGLRQCGATGLPGAVGGGGGSGGGGNGGGWGGLLGDLGGGGGGGNGNGGGGSPYAACGGDVTDVATAGTFTCLFNCVRWWGCMERNAAAGNYTPGYSIIGAAVANCLGYCHGIYADQVIGRPSIPNAQQIIDDEIHTAIASRANGALTALLYELALLAGVTKDGAVPIADDPLGIGAVENAGERATGEKAGDAFVDVIEVIGLAKGVAAGIKKLLCFPADTPVLKGDGSPVPIDTVDVGDRVAVYYAEAPAGCVEAEIDPETWRRFELSVPEPDGGTTRVVLLRPADWSQGRELALGDVIPLSLSELGVDGPATVVAIDPCPVIEPGLGRVVTATFAHSSGSVLDLYLDGDDRPLGVTANHPVYSADRRAFVPAGELRVGECLRTADGTAAVTALEPRPDREPVFNLEIDGEHVYHVGHAAILVHNQKGPKTVGVSRSRYPQSAQHIDDAQRAGRPSTLTVDRAGASGRRAEALRGRGTRRGLDRDEYPPAVFREGGSGSSVRHINPGDNRGAGASIGNQLRGVADGQRVKVKVVP